jgi:hypothetical protein
VPALHDPASRHERDRLTERRGPGEPLLLTSDNPVGLWTTARDGEQPSHGASTAQAIFLPLDRQTALAMVHRGTDAVATPGSVRARVINLAVASGAERWIFHHPSDRPLRQLQLPPRADFVNEIVNVTRTGDDVRELHRLTKRAPLPPQV